MFHYAHQQFGAEQVEYRGSIEPFLGNQVMALEQLRLGPQVLILRTLHVAIPETKQSACSKQGHFLWALHLLYHK